MLKIAKWGLPVAGALLGLGLSFLINPTLFECKLFTACHQTSFGYTFVSLFEPGVHDALTHERFVLGIAHNLSYSVIGLMLGALGTILVLLLERRMAPDLIATPVFAMAAEPAMGTEQPVQSHIVLKPVLELELSGLGEFSRYYLKIDTHELREMRDGFLIGRDPQDINMIIGEDGISRRHARMTVDDDRFELEDLGSTNGTKLNGRNLRAGERVHLRSGDRVAFGAVSFSVTVKPGPSEG